MLTHGIGISAMLIQFSFLYVRTIASLLITESSRLVSQAALRLAPRWHFSVRVNQRRFSLPKQ